MGFCAGRALYSLNSQVKEKKTKVGHRAIIIREEQEADKAAFYYLGSNLRYLNGWNILRVKLTLNNPFFGIMGHDNKLQNLGDEWARMKAKNPVLCEYFNFENIGKY